MGTSELSLPRMLGRYALYEKIASGGMASIHIGRLLGPVGFSRTVAVKRMHPHFSEDPEFVSMFLDEARLAARIRHPNVVPTLDVVATAGELFLVMEFVQGESLSRLIRAAIARDARIPPEMVATLMVGVLHGLHAAHEATSDHGEPLGIVHRDVSPHNILVGTDGVARVLDFGVAKAVGRLQTTREGQLKGKLAYMAPEQVRGEVSRLTDVYSASVVLWEALTCKRLVKGDNEAELVSLVLDGCSEPPSKHVPGLPAALDEVTMRGLSVDPAKRFPTARDMARALEEAIPLATASRIGDWVEAAAKETLQERSAQVARVESDTDMHARATHERAQEETAAGTPSAAATRDSADSLRIDVGATSTQLSSGSVSQARVAFRPGARRNAWIAAGGAGLLAAALVVAFSGPSAKPSPATSGAHASSPEITQPTTGAPSPSVSIDTPPSSVAAARSAEAAQVPFASGAATLTGPKKPRPARTLTKPVPAARPSATAPPPCALVKTLDKNGEPHFTCPCASCQ